MEEEEKELDPFTDYELKDFANTDCDHEYAVDDKQDPNTELISVRCIKCPSGVMINPDEFKVKEGKVVKIT